MSARNVRQFAAQAFRDAFGEPERFQTVDGVLNRWRLTAADGTIIRITLDSPEFPSLAHFLLSDSRAVVHLSAETCRTPEDVQALIAQIKSRLNLDSVAKEPSQHE